MNNYKVLIVDDDQNFRYAAREMLPWKKYNFVITEEAVNGKQALELMHQERFDLVVTDMSMPLMNGVELIRIAKKEFPDVLFIALSAYDDFEFVKESLKCGAEDYILKYDMEEAKTEQVIAEMKNKLLEMLKEKERRQFIMHKENFFIEGFLKSIVEGKEYSSEQLGTCMELLEIGSEVQLCVLIMKTNRVMETDIIDQLKIIRPRGMAFCQLDECSGFLLYDFGTSRSMSEVHGEKQKFMMDVFQCIKEKEYQEVTLGVSDFCYKWEGIREAYKQAEAACGRSVYQGKNQIYDYGFESTVICERVVKVDYLSLQNAVHHQDLEGFTAVLHHLEEEILRVQPDVKYLDKLLQDIYIFIYTEVLKKKDMKRISFGDLEGLKVSLEKEDSFNGKMETLNKYLRPVYAVMTDGKKVYSKDISRAVHYIKEHFKEDLNLKEVAGYIGLSENYLSNLFKKETGENMVTYMNRCRIELAKELIADTGMKVYEIAEEVGFKNTTYFSTTFKRMTNMTVQEFKNRKK